MRGYISLGAVLIASSAFANPLVPEFGNPDTRELRTIATAEQKLDNPRDLAFNPDAPRELWVVNRHTDSTSILIDAGTRNQSLDWRKDRYANHFMEEVSSIAFGAATFNGTMTFGTCHESRNTYDGSWPRGNDFMGPTLWPADLEVYARANQDNRLLGSHIDMLHQSPLCMGMAHKDANIYYVFDGLAGHLVSYDFVKDHGPGADDHSDGIVRRYPEVKLKRVENVPGHMVFDADKTFLYIADPGNKRILKVDTRTGEFDRRLRARNEPLAEFSSYKNVSFEVFADSDLGTPSGLAINEDRLFVTDYASGDIIALSLSTGNELDRLSTEQGQGIMGITLDEEGSLWFVNGDKNLVMKVER